MPAHLPQGQGPSELPESEQVYAARLKRPRTGLRDVGLSP